MLLFCCGFRRSFIGRRTGQYGVSARRGLRLLVWRTSRLKSESQDTDSARLCPLFCANSMVGLRGNKGFPGCFLQDLKVWFWGFCGAGFGGVSAVCFLVAHGGSGGFSGFRLCGGGLVFWFVRTRGWCFGGCCGRFVVTGKRDWERETKLKKSCGRYGDYLRPVSTIQSVSGIFLQEIGTQSFIPFW